MNWTRAIPLVGLGIFVAVSGCLANEEDGDGPAGPVNRVDISEFLSTSGQPAAGYFSVLADQGFEMVINLAPPQSHGSLQNEGGLVASRGLTYVNIPVDWDNPEPEHFEFFAKLLSENQSRKVLVHCQVGFRASIFTFLYRAIFLQRPADEALEFVHQVWAPNDAWTAFANDLLDAHDIDFELMKN